MFPVQSLVHDGFEANVVHIDQVTENQIAAADVVVFHRPSISERFKKVLAWAKSKSNLKPIKLLADFDDLLFVTEESSNSAAVRSGALSESVAKSLAQDYLDALECFDACIVSTQPLAEWVRSVTSTTEVHVIPNRLPQSWFFQNNVVDIHPRFAQKVLRYLPGTSHHDGDFDFIKPILTEFLNTNADVTLEVIGPLRFELPDVDGKQIRHAGAVPFDRLAALMADSWVCIAPLLDTSFNQCKSGLKFWESGLYGVPLVASPLADFDDFRCEGLLEVRTHDEWIGALTSLLDWEYYQAASEAAAKSAQRVLHGSEPNPYVTLFELDTLRQAQGERIDVVDNPLRQAQGERVGVGDNTLRQAQGERIEVVDNPLRQDQSEQVDEEDSTLRQTQGERESGHREEALDETLFNRVQQQFFASWFGPGWQAFILKPRIDLAAADMPGEVVDQATQFKLLQSIWSGEHWSSNLLGVWNAEKVRNLPITLGQLPELPSCYESLMSGQYSSWQEWVDDLGALSQSLWKQQAAPVGSPFMRKWRKFRRSPKHFFKDARSPWLRWLARFV